MAFSLGSLRANRARRALLTLATTDYAVLRLLAIELDLQPGDSESMSFLVAALNEAARQIECGALNERLDSLSTGAPP